MLNKSEIKELLQARFSKDTHTKLCELPLPSELKDAYKAAERIKLAVLRHEKIAIVGDYDVDGVVSSAIIAEFLNDVGAQASVRIPNRFKDGYGLNEQLIEELGDVNLIITVDNGISANEAAEICAQKGIDLIVTDHHMPANSLPNALAIVNPKQSDCPFPNIEICGAEVIWYVVAALKEIFGLKDYDLSKFIDILALAIIADMMELRDMNRVLVRAGIKRLNSSPRPFVRAIKDYYGKEKFEFDDIGFLIAPLINSAGRMDDATISYRFLRSANSDEANSLLDVILEFNNSRKAKEKTLFEESIKDIDESDNIIVTWGEFWHEGVIGIVASRLAKRYKKPAIVFSVDGCRAKGSARSIDRFDILSLIASQEKIINSFGGHRGAAGLVIDSNKLSEFKRAINNSCPLSNVAPSLSDEILGEIELSQIDFDLMKIIEDFEPYGQKNPRPVFEIKNALITSVKTIGNGDAHLKIGIQSGEFTLEGLFFNYDYRPKVGDSVDLLASISKNIFRGVVNLQLLIKEIYS